MAEETEETTEAGSEEGAAQAGSEGNEETSGNDDQQEQKQEETKAASEEKTDWRDPIKDADTLKFAEQFAMPSDAVELAFKMRKQLSNAISIPGKDAEEDDVKEFWAKLGRPEEAAGYEFNMPEGQEANEADTAFHGQMGQIFHAANITADQAAILNAGWNEMTVATQEALKTAAEEARTSSEEQLKNLWGDDHDANVVHSKRAIAAFGDDAFLEFLDNTQVGGDQLGSHPMMNKIFATIGRRLGEGTINLAMTEGEKSTGEERRGELTEEIHAAQKSGDTKKAKRLMQEREDLTIKLHGDEKI